MRVRITAVLVAAATAAGVMAAGSSQAAVAPTALTALTAPEVRLAPAAGRTSPVEFIVSYDPSRTTGTALATAITAANPAAKTKAYTQFPVVAALGNAAAIKAATAHRGVTVVEPVAKLELLDTAPNHTIKVEGARAAAPAGLGVTGEGVTLGIIDSGVDGGHPDLAGRIQRNAKIASTWLTCDGDPFVVECDQAGRQPGPIEVGSSNGDTTSGHGTHVAGSMVGDGTASNGRYTGVAPGAKLSAAGVGDGENVLWALDGFEYLLAHAAEDNTVVINNSYGPSRENPTSHSAPPTGSMPAAIKAAIDRGIAVVFAAGNDGNDTADTVDYCRPEQQFSNINPYGLLPGVITAAASLRDGVDTADFSSCGKADGDRSHDPTVTAPGHIIISTRGSTGAVIDGVTTGGSLGKDYVAISGTSMAAPHVAGVIGLIQSARQKAGMAKLTPAELKTVLTQTADVMPGVAVRRQGSGMLDAAEAVARALSATTPAAAPTQCPVVTDEAGDASNVIAATPLPSAPSLDLRTADVRTEGDQLVVTFGVTDLTLLDPQGGLGLYYEFQFQTDSHKYYAAASYANAQAGTYGARAQTATFQFGNIDSLRAVYAVPVTGTFDEAADTVTIRFPVAAAGHFDFTGDTLGGILAYSRRVLNNVVPDADTAYSTRSYVVGNVC
jgi:serine protease AprX